MPYGHDVGLPDFDFSLSSLFLRIIGKKEKGRKRVGKGIE